MDSSRLKVAPPDYFASVLDEAKEMWDRWEEKRHEAAGALQMFKQLLSPRYVLSELLQNADDAGAKHVTVSIQDGCFCFEHDGHDFTKLEFTSLCRFGFSNKRNLHTIGFRGIGFKSTFSLGSVVQVQTPSLAVRFSKDRFTEPIWADDLPFTAGQTRIQVELSDANRASELQKNLEDWLQSPTSLLFFRSVKSIDLCGEKVSREVLGDGPAPNTKLVLPKGGKRKLPLRF